MKNFYLYIGAMNGYGRREVVAADFVKIVEGVFCFYTGEGSTPWGGGQDFIAAYPTMFTEIYKVEEIKE